MSNLSFIKKLERKLIRIIPKRVLDIAPNEAIVSITFDDFPASAAHEAKQILSENGLLATYYLASGMLNTINDRMQICSDEDVRNIANAGHEIGCHTYSHMDCIKVNASKTSDLEKDLIKNYNHISKLAGIPPVSFSYPFGGISFASRQLISKRFEYARGIYSGINTGKTDIMNLKANSIYSTTYDTTKISTLLAETKKCKGWCIFYTHDVTNNASDFGCSPEQFRAFIKLIIESKIQVLPVKHAMGYLAFNK